MKIQTFLRSRLVLLPLVLALAPMVLGCLALGFIGSQLMPFPGATVRSLTPVASLACNKYPVPTGQRGSYCAWYMGAATVLAVNAPPEQVIAWYDPKHLVIRAGQIQFAIGAETTEDVNPQRPPLFPVYFGFSLFLEGLP